MSCTQTRCGCTCQPCLRARQGRNKARHCKIHTNGCHLNCGKLTMNDRKHMIVLSTGNDSHGAIHSRAWYIQPEALEHLAFILTHTYGEPFEWVSDETENGQSHLVYYEEDTP